MVIQGVFPPHAQHFWDWHQLLKMNECKYLAQLYMIWDGANQSRLATTFKTLWICLKSLLTHFVLKYN